MVDWAMTGHNAFRSLGLGWPIRPCGHDHHVHALADSWKSQHVVSD